MPDPLDAERLRSITTEMIEALTSPEYLEQVQAVREAPEEERLVEASNRLSVDALRAAGVRLPRDMRISSRYFEESFPSAVEFGDTPGAEPNVVNELNRIRPGWLDEVRHKDPEIFERLVAIDRPPALGGLGSPTDNLPQGWGACAGGGAATVCGCAGGST